MVGSLVMASPFGGCARHRGYARAHRGETPIRSGAVPMAYAAPHPSRVGVLAGVLLDDRRERALPDRLRLGPEGGDHELGHLPGRVLRLVGDQPRVPIGEGLEQAALDVVGTALAELVFDAVRHHLLPDRPVRGVLLDVREAGHGLPFDEVRAVRELHVDQRGDAVTEDGGRLLGLVEGGDSPLQALVLAELKHRCLTAADDERVEGVEVEVGEPGRVLEELGQLGSVEEAHRDEVVGRPFRLVARVREGVELDLAAVRAGDRDAVPHAGELVVGVGQLGGPDTDRPAGRRRDRRVRDHHQDRRTPAGRDIDGLVMLLCVLRGYHRCSFRLQDPTSDGTCGSPEEQAQVVVLGQGLLVPTRESGGRRLAGVVTPEVRQMRYFTAVAEHGSFTGAARELHVTQQAVSQQVKALEGLLGVTLLERSPRRVELTPEGRVFLADCRRVLAGADRAARRVQAAARGEAGTLRLVYTLVSAFETVPLLLDRLDRDYPLLKVDAREVFGCDITDLLRDGDCDLALAPLTSYPEDIRQRTIRREVLRVAVGEHHRLAHFDQIAIPSLRDETLELWPHEMAPGYYDAIIAACRTAGFEPNVDHHGAGSTVWGYIAEGRGVGLVVSSLIEQLPRGVKLIDLSPPRPILTVNAVWRQDQELPAIERFFETAKQLAHDRHWV